LDDAKTYEDMVEELAQENLNKEEEVEKIR